MKFDTDEGDAYPKPGMTEKGVGKAVAERLQWRKDDDDA